MKFEVIKENKKKKIIIGGLIILSLVSALTFVTSRAKYTNSQSIKIARGTVKIDNADLKVIAVKLSDDGTNYTDTNEVPTSGYVLNTDMTKCFVNGTEDTTINVTYENGKINVLNIATKGTKCNIYFDKLPTAEDTLATLNITDYKTIAPDFTKVATGNEGVYATSDEMYGGTTYYWRGATTNNYVKFAGFCWRIVRINGDGSIRLIYDGATCHANGTSTSESIAISSIVYNSAGSNNSSHVGWSYTVESQRPNNTSPQTGGTRTTIRVTLEDTWYKTNITNKGYDGKVATGKFCNDRNTGPKYSGWSGTWSTSWSAAGTQFAYAAAGRLGNGTMIPTTSCPNGDMYELKVGLITADEAQFAGASWTTSNTSYYLYNGQTYWTMSPNAFTGGRADVLFVRSNGSINSHGVHTNQDVRPVINLNTDTQFQASGNGSIDTPYIVI